MPHRSIAVIANDILRAWPTPYYAARPYLAAMHELRSIDDPYIHPDGARSVVRGFLGNAQHFRGEKAKALKAELKAML